MEIKNNKYIKNFKNEPDELDFLIYKSFHKFYLDHTVLKEFIEIEEEAKPQKFEEMGRLSKPFEYYSQVLQFSADCGNLIHKEIMGFIAQVR